MRTSAVLGVGLPLALASSACSGNVTHRERIPFSGGDVDLVVSSIGGALGEERYELKFQNEGETVTFFRGGNFSEFNVSEVGGKLNIQICQGFIDHAEPILLGSGENNHLVRLNLDWNCKDKSREV